MPKKTKGQEKAKLDPQATLYARVDSVTQERIYTSYVRRLTTPALVAQAERTIHEKGFKKADKRALQLEVNRRLAIYHDFYLAMNKHLRVDRPKTLKATVDQATEMVEEYSKIMNSRSLD